MDRGAWRAIVHGKESNTTQVTEHISLHARIASLQSPVLSSGWDMLSVAEEISSNNSYLSPESLQK